MPAGLLPLEIITMGPKEAVIERPLAEAREEAIARRALTAERDPAPLELNARKNAERGEVIALVSLQRIEGTLRRGL